jgi:hypothetical protein
MISVEEQWKIMLNQSKQFFFAYLEGFTCGKTLIWDEKLSRVAYRQTTFNAWLRKNHPGLPTLMEEELNECLDKFLAE